MAFLSIIVPVFNKEKYIDNCIQSILSQTFKDFELILVNDGSTDSSGFKCDCYKNMDNRIIVFHQENQGVSSARNKGISIATGDYIGFVDADDTIDVNMYETLIDNATSNNADIAICRLNTSEKPTIHLNRKNVEVFNRNEGLSAFFKGELDYGAYNKIYKKTIVKNLQFEGRMFEDVFYTFRALLLSNKAVLNQNKMYNYFIRDNSVSISKFSLKYLDLVYVTKKIVNIVLEKMPAHLEAAKVFDFVTNMFLLNKILLAGEKYYMNEYKMIVERLNGYSVFLNETKAINKKHRIAYHLFTNNSKAYLVILKIYCFIFPSHASGKA